MPFALLVLLLVFCPLRALAVPPGSVSAGHAMKAGETLAQVAESVYGHRHYQLVIIKLNNIKDPAALAPGTVVRVPDLKEMLLTEGLPKSLAPELEAVNKARYGYMRVREELIRAIRPGNSTGKIQVPASVKAELRGDAEALEKAGKVLARQGNFSESATRMRQRLAGAAAIMRKLANGSKEKGLEDQVHLLMAQAFVRGLMWARNEDGDIKEYSKSL